MVFKPYLVFYRRRYGMRERKKLRGWEDGKMRRWNLSILDCGLRKMKIWIP